MLSVESIYLWIYQLRKQGGIDYTKNLRHRHRKNRKRRLLKDRRTIIKDKVNIHQRPEIVNTGERVGDLETDLVRCTNGYLLTVTDRKTLFNFIVSIPNKEANTVQEALIKVLSPYTLTKARSLRLPQIMEQSLSGTKKWHKHWT